MPSVAIVGTRGYPSYYGGFETAVRKLAPYLVEQGWDVTVYGRPGATRSDDPSRDPRVHAIETRGVESKSLSTLSYGLTATGQTLRRRPDVALVMNVANGYFLPLLQMRGIPSLVNVDGIEWDRAKWGRLAKATFRGGAKMTARFATELVVDARAIGERWQAEFGRDGIFIPYGGDPSDDLPVEPGLTRGAYALVVARFVPENTIPEFFDAVDALGNETDVVIVGSSGYGGELDERARQLALTHPRVTWLGHVHDDTRLRSLWQHAGAYFHGHSVGGTNPALVQAMAVGAPIVARDTIYNREVLASGGLFVKPGAREIANGIRTLIADETLRLTLSADARERAAQYYSWPSVCAAYEEALRACADGERSPSAADASASGGANPR
ncbi:glycosyltransferase [Agromyces aerolatus]|uniref:glycosyltransferase n=1 Tax=Agromyces sp. LY-1074 TaxID=3074080 RepID=UPI0028653AF3|nr:MULTISPECIES: glycosyltransferase [unclassified Agromyces]MDR5701476.1 glycosyltransferase [Agromyces sp. LY-1074]MDR5704457.1 glycosyltransferase [Agromyces sp. LY-1358]